MVIGKKELGIAVRALAQYASDCSGNGDYIEMKKSLKIAMNIAGMYGLKELEMTENTYKVYMGEAQEQLEETIEEGRRAYDILAEISK